MARHPNLTTNGPAPSHDATNGHVVIPPAAREATNIGAFQTALDNQRKQILKLERGFEELKATTCA
jgi:hypothetical protein